MGLHVQYPSFQDNNQNRTSSKDFRKIVEFHENPSSGSRVVACGRTDMTKLTDAFRSVANARRNSFEFTIDGRPSAN